MPGFTNRNCAQTKRFAYSKSKFVPPLARTANFFSNGFCGVAKNYKSTAMQNPVPGDFELYDVRRNSKRSPK